MNKTFTGLIVIDHGSRLAEANRLLDQVVESLRKRGEFSIVEPAHMELAEPTLQDAFANCARQGAQRVVIMPYFLAHGSHVTNDIPRLAREAGTLNPGILWALAEPLGLDERIIDLVSSRFFDAVSKGAFQAVT